MVTFKICYNALNFDKNWNREANFWNVITANLASSARLPHPFFVHRFPLLQHLSTFTPPGFIFFQKYNTKVCAIYVCVVY